MEKHQLLVLPRRLQGALQPPDLPQQHLFVVGPLVVQLVKPPTGAAQGQLSVELTVVVENFHGGQLMLPEEPLHLGGGVPPVVVVALEQILLPRQGVDEPEVLQRFLQTHAPGQVAAQHGDVLRPQSGEGLLQPEYIVLPAVSEDLHGFVGIEGQMQVPQSIQRHAPPPLPILYQPPQIVPEQVLQQRLGIAPVRQRLPQQRHILQTLHPAGQQLAAVHVAAQTQGLFPVQLQKMLHMAQAFRATIISAPDSRRTRSTVARFRSSSSSSRT